MNERIIPNPDGSVTVIFGDEETVTFSGLEDAQGFIEWLENAPPEMRGAIQQGSLATKPGQQV